MNERKDPAAFDHQSDPARTPGDGWVGEGGASHLGPATNIESGRSADTDDSDTVDSDTGDSDTDDLDEHTDQ
jgi:hypothetical protein